MNNLFKAQPPVIYTFKYVTLILEMNYTVLISTSVSHVLSFNREVKHDVYGKRQTAKMKLLPSVFSFQYSRIKIFVSVVNSKRHFSIFFYLFKDYKKRIENQK